MAIDRQNYNQYIKDISPKSPSGKNIIKAFLVGGLICALGEGLKAAYVAFGISAEAAAVWVSASLIFLGAFLTGIGIYDKIAKHAGAGTIVPITGFANAVVSAALEFKSEGYVLGMSAKMFTVAGPVLVFGISGSIIYGLLLLLWQAR